MRANAFKILNMEYATGKLSPDSDSYKSLLWVTT